MRVSLFCLFLLVPTAASADAASNPTSRSCSQHAVVGGLAHQPTKSDIEAALAICRVPDPVDTSPAVGRIIDELNDRLLGQAHSP